MKPKRSIEKYGKIRRISVTVLLFTFCSISMLSQVPDSITIDPDESKGRLSDPPKETRQPPLRLVDDSIQGTVFHVDSTGKEELEEGHSPRKAMIYSIVLPGLGQAYNKKYWKIPIVYAALAGAGYAIYFNLGQYRLASAAYSADGGQTDLNERYLRYYRRNLELSFIGLVVVDALAVVDAYVDANLFYWDVDPDLTLRVEPSIQPIFNASGTMRNNYGFKCSLTF